MEKDTNYCRLCMSEENLSVMDSSVIHIIRNEFSIEIHNDDELSQEICNACSNFLPRLKAFKEKVLKTQNLLQKILKRKDRVNVNNESVSNNKTVDLKDHYEGTEANVIEDLTEAADTISSEDDLITKIVKSIDLNEIEKRMQKTDKVRWNPEKSSCDVCKVKIPDREKYVKHFKSSSHHFKNYIIAISGNVNIFDDNLIGYTCQICRQKFTSKTVMSTHSKDIHQVSINKNLVKPDTLIPKSCLKNGDGAKEARVLEEVEVKVEPGSSNIYENLKKHPCKLCPKLFGFTESLMNHVKRHHPGTHFCLRCDFTSINRQSFATHLRSHYNLVHPQRICTACFKVCQNYRDFAVHRKEAHEAAILICPVCSLKFSNSTLFKKHKRDVHRIHQTKGSTFFCKKCHRSFMSALVLEKHQCVALKFPCLKNCGKRFGSFSEMERHKKICLSGRTIFVCSNCNKTLKSLRTLKKHMMTCEKLPLPSASHAVAEKTACNTSHSEKSDQENVECAVASSSKSAILSLENCHKSPTQQMTSSNKIRLVKKTISKKQKKKTKKFGSKCDEKLKSELKKQAKIPALITSPASSWKSTPTTSCKTCGLVFKDSVFLKKHKLSCNVSSSQVEDGNKATRFSIEEKIPPVNLPTSSSINNVLAEKHRQQPPESRNNSTPSPNFSIRKGPSVLTLSTRTNKNESFEDRQSQRPRINPNTPSRTTLLRPEYLMKANGPKKPEQLTIIQNGNLTCNICRNPAPHLFCRPCARCFVQNQVQYLNHMKMKHSGV